ncbi:MAG TPA: hypothetical protein VGL64_12725 [Amycolatopsis sp.]|jgi:hypothetical protein
MTSPVLVMPGQRRLHFTSESDGRHPTILVTDLAATGARMLVLETDESILDVDRRTLYRAVRTHDCQEALEYRHFRAHEELLLVIPDAIAWCWQRGGQWKKRVRELVTDIRVV